MSRTSMRWAGLVFLFGLIFSVAGSMLARLVFDYIHHDRGTLLRLVNHGLAGEGGTLPAAAFFFIGISIPLLFKKKVRSRAELRLSEAKHRAVLNTAVDGIITVNYLGIVESFNIAASHIFGYGAEDVIGRNISMLMPEPYRSGHDQYIRNYLAGGTPKIVGVGREVIGLRKDGTMVPLHLSVSEVETGGKRLFTGILRDITEQKESEVRLLEAKEEMQAIYDVMVDGILIADGVTRMFVRANPSACRMFGYSEDEMIHLSVSDIHPGGDLSRIIADFKKMAKGKKDIGENIPCLRRDGSVFYSDIATRRITYRGRPCLIGFFKDITDRKEVEDKLRLSAKFFESSNEAIVITDEQASILDVNSAYCSITGYTKDELIGKNPRIMKSGRHDQSFYVRLWQTLLDTGQWQGEIWDRRKNGEVFPKWLSISAVKDSLGVTTHYVGFFSDISTLKQTEERLTYIAHFDTLTGLPNRFLFRDRLRLSINNAVRKGTLGALFFLDLDRFKTINDTLGHQAGDSLLIETAKRLTACVRETDTVSRLGGDEFAVVLPDFEEPLLAAAIADKIITAVSEPFTVQGHEVFVTASIGITIYPLDGVSPDTLAQNADTAMYHAKESGKDNYKFFTSEMNIRIFERLAIETNLRRALERQEFVLHYQPRLDLSDDHVAGAEALIRWNDPEKGMIMPSTFISVAEDTGMIVPIGEWVMSTAFLQAAEWIRKGRLALPVAVNVSSRQFQQPDLAKKVGNAIEVAGIDPAYVEIEVTESDVMQNIDEAIVVMDDLKRMGVRIAIDDFGTGYSSLSRLRRLPIDMIKIDQSFVRDISSDPGAESIVLAIIGLAHSLGMKVIAEGVETEEQLSFLSRHGCDEVQGFLKSRPLIAGEFERFMASRTKD